MCKFNRSVCFNPAINTSSNVSICVDRTFVIMFVQEKCTVVKVNFVPYFIRIKENR